MSLLNLEASCVECAPEVAWSWLQKEKKMAHTKTIQKDGLWGRVFKDFSTFLQAEAHLSTPLSMARAFLAAWLFCHGLKDQRSTLLPVEDLTACEGA